MSHFTKQRLSWAASSARSTPAVSLSKRFYHHIFTTDTTIVSLIEELGLGDRLVWKDSKVGFFNGGKIWPFVTPLDLLRFKPLPLIDRVRLGLAGLYLRRKSEWSHYEEVTAWEWIRKNAGQKALDVVWGPLLKGKFADQAEEVAMAWLWSKIHLRFASRKTGASQKEQLGYMMGSFGVYIKELERRIRAGRHGRDLGAGREDHDRLGRTRRWPHPARTAAASTPTPSSPACLQSASCQWRPAWAPTTSGGSRPSAGSGRCATCWR